MVRVLHILTGGDFFGGAENFLCQYYANMDRKKIRFDFLFCSGDSMRGKWNDPVFLQSRHVSLDLDISMKNMPRLERTVERYLKNHRYDIVHINMGTMSIQYACLVAAKRADVKCRIAHSHSSGINSSKKTSIIERLARRFVQKRIFGLSTFRAACSMDAGRHIFGDGVPASDIHIIRNAIDLKEYRYDSEERSLVREELNVKNCKVYMQLGRLSRVKNHLFSLGVFKDIVKREPDSRLIIIGKGELRKEIEDAIANLGLEGKAILLGFRTDIYRLLQAADCVLSPSLWEGFPFVLLEAQASGTKAICSDGVPREVNVTGDCEFLPLRQDIWVDRCIHCDMKKNDNYEKLKQEGYDIYEAAKRLESEYIKMAEQ